MFGCKYWVMKILCRTLFDCSRTGTTGHFRLAQIPYTDAAGYVINSVLDWNFSRNQQRNFETIMQIISLRAQPNIVVNPVHTDGQWCFEFEVETAGVYSKDGSAHDTSALLAECQGAPMICGLTESLTTVNFLETTGAEQNIWFETINI